MNEPCAFRYDFDGHGWRYMDSGSGSDWLERAKEYPDAEFLYENPTSAEYLPIHINHLNLLATMLEEECPYREGTKSAIDWFEDRKSSGIELRTLIEESKQK